MIDSEVLHVVTTRLMSVLQMQHDTEYIKKRLDLFESFTFPSLMSQTNSSFIWLLFTSVDLPTEHMTRLSAITSSYKNVFVLPIKTTKIKMTGEYDQVFLDFIKSHTFHYDFMLTSRIDDDDAWRLNYVEAVQNIARKFIHNKNKWKNYSGIAMTFPHGRLFYPYVFDNRGRYGLAFIYYQYFSASVDIITPNKIPQNFYAFEHSSTKKNTTKYNYYRYSHKTAKPMWLYTQHLSNVGKTRDWYNKFKMAEFFLPTRRNKPGELSFFGIEDKIQSKIKEKYEIKQ